MHRRKLEELNLLDDFLLNRMATYPGIGEEFCRILLEIIFRRKFGKLRVEAQKVYYGTDTDKHGARLDVYLEEETDELSVPAIFDIEDDGLSIPTVFDVEAEQKDNIEEVTALPWRTRFYHAKIDAASLTSGISYKNLKNVVVVMIMPIDPFGLNWMTYTVRNMCAEVPEMPYEDGARTLFLYTRGNDNDSSIELKQLLSYMEDTNRANAGNAMLNKIQDMVDIVKHDEEVSLSYMKIWEREEMLIRKGQAIERANTERERANAERERQRANKAEEEIMRLREKIMRLTGDSD